MYEMAVTLPLSASFSLSCRGMELEMKFFRASFHGKKVCVFAMPVLLNPAVEPDFTNHVSGRHR
jgi:hypothetical protein